jgi:hypothetical protein
LNNDLHCLFCSCIDHPYEMNHDRLYTVRYYFYFGVIVKMK